MWPVALARAKAIPDSRLGQEVTGMIRIFFDFATKSADVGPEIVALFSVFGPPDPLEENGMAENLSGASGKLHQ